MATTSAAGGPAATPPVVPPGEAKPGGPGLGDETYPEYGNGGYDGEFGPLRKQPAAVLDGSGYAARLVVLPTFGCALHEERS